MPLGEFRPDPASTHRFALSAPGESAELPLDLQLDLLVDGELPESDRRQLLQDLDRPAAGVGEARWRDLAIRFLERQTEKQTARELMAGGCLMPAELLGGGAERFWLRFRGWRSWTAAASFLLLASAAVIYFEYPRSPATIAVASNQFNVVLPADTVGNERGLPVSVTLVKNPGADQSLFPVSGRQNLDDLTRHSVLIEPVSNGAVAIPVDQFRASFN